MLEDAIILATRAHADQVDKAGQPYILHPLRVMNALSYPEGRILGVLHDVLEDVPEFEPDVRKLFGTDIALWEALQYLTRRDG